MEQAKASRPEGRGAGPAPEPAGQDAANTGPLVGVRVIEIGQLIAGPYAGHILADFGAEVIKIEAPGQGDPMREWGHYRYKDRALWWPSLSRNKKSISLDLRQPQGQELFRGLVAKSDVVIENFRPGTLEQWKLGPEELHALNPGLILARVSGFGQTGPYSTRAGFASVGEAMGGLRYINGHPGDKPPRAGISLGDSLAAMSAVQGILMALVWRAGPGKGQGQVIDATITEACFALMEGALTEYAHLGVVREPSGAALKNVAPSNVYRSQDGSWIVIAANADRIFERLCKAMGQPELARDPRFDSHTARGSNADAIDAIIQEWASGLYAQEIDTVLNEFGVVCGPIYSIADIHDDPHFRAREMICEINDPQLGTITVPGIVPKMSRTPGLMRWTGPERIGAHNEDVYGGILGLDDAQRRELTDKKVI